MVQPGPAYIGVRPGDVLAGKYRVERVLGAGGMGVVVQAHHVQLDERVALKFLLPEALQNPEAVARFLREARAVVKIKGEHVARVSDVGQLENGAPYIVMEYLEGSDLSGWLKQRGALPIEMAVDFVLQACEALADAHVLGIVHRDLKPANLFCVQRSDGQLSIKVLDFGISKVMTPGAAGGDMTRTHALVGSPYYMSPEQMTSSKAVDPRTDIWSLGVILFELVTGRPPFEAEAVTELAIKIAMEPAPLVRHFIGDVPPALEHAVAKCLEKDRTRRFQSVGELAVALKDVGSRRAAVSVDRVLGTLRQAGLSNNVVDRAPPGGPSFPSGPALQPGQFGPPNTPAPNAPNAFGSQPALGSWDGRPSPNAPNTSASWGHTGPSAPGQKVGGKVVLGLAAVVLVGALGIGAWMALRKPATPSTAAQSAAPTQAAAPLVAVPTVAPSIVTLPAIPAASASVPAPPDAPALASVPLPAVPPNPQPRPQRWPDRVPSHPNGAASAALPAAAPAAKANCTPPYYFDAAGHKQYKSECM
jgi:serine/threonine protein kinase